MTKAVTNFVFDRIHTDTIWFEDFLAFLKIDPAAEEQKINDLNDTIDKFKDECYKAYQLDWMINHGYSLSDYLSAVKEQMAEIMEEEDVPDTDIFNAVNLAADEFEDERGFGSGSIWVCKDEFLGAEFLDAGYMQRLLATMGDYVNRSRLWEEITGLKIGREAA